LTFAFGQPLASWDTERRGRVALIEAESGRALSYGQLDAAVGEAACLLATPRKALLFLFCRNGLPSVLLYLAALRQGHAVALLDAALDPELKRQLIERYCPDLVWLPEGGSAPSGWALDAAGLHPWRQGCLWRRTSEPPVLHPELALLLPTSGSTGSPKLVRLSAAALEANAAAIAQGLGLTPADRAITSLPLFYAYGLSVLSSHLWAGASVVLSAASAMERNFWDALRDHQCSSFAGVPYTYQMLQRLGFDKLDLPSLRVLTQAGGRLEPRLVQRFHEQMAARGGRFFVMYGQTEAVARIAILPAERLPEKLGAVGCAVPGGELRIDEQAAPPGSPTGVGEVVYRGPNVMWGYAESASDLARGDELGGELRTGDLGYLDADGVLFITGRSKRMGKLFGVRVNLDDIESMVREHGPAAVLDGGDRLLLFCAFGDPEALAALQRELAARLRVHRSGLELRRIDELPLLASGKVDYQRLPA
jgi:acyl-CoA synthetase (AMP-forming)/AMP-acid ligase II